MAKFSLDEFLTLCNFKVILMPYDKLNLTFVLNLSNLLQKSNEKLSKPHILSLFLISFKKINNTRALM